MTVESGRGCAGGATTLSLNSIPVNDGFSVAIPSLILAGFRHENSLSGFYFSLLVYFLLRAGVTSITTSVWQTAYCILRTKQ
jgi:hypothetical protein